MSDAWSSADADTDLHAFMERHERVFVAFSGGKESVVLADLAGPWREKVSLLWVRTEFAAPHMVDFVRSFRGRFTLIEVEAPPIGSAWEVDGVPAEVLSVDHATGRLAPKQQPWLACCHKHRVRPMYDYLSAYEGTAGFLAGLRADDRGGVPSGVQAMLPATIEAMMPIWDWSLADVMGHIEARGLALPRQYAEGVLDSLECIVCPSQATRAKVDYLRKHHPEAAVIAHKIAAGPSIAAIRSAREILDTWGPGIPDPQDGKVPEGEAVN